MKNRKKLQQTYEWLLDLIKQGKNELISIEANKYTVEELEQLTNFGFENEVGEKLFKILMLCRKEKLNSQLF
jgi:type II secretory pathway predicted ATPase ExeA